jgi:hypothetical protein
MRVTLSDFFCIALILLNFINEPLYNNLILRRWNEAKFQAQLHICIYIGIVLFALH